VDVYVVTAYRLGQTNNHQYVCFVGTDRALAIQAAREENEGRGLKYGVQVVAWPAREACAYFPSYGEARDARGPVESADRFAAEMIGETVLLAFNRGIRFAPSGEEFVAPSGETVKTLTEVHVELPDWLKEECEHRLDLAHRLTGG
jgi:hypothetical protein